MDLKEKTATADLESLQRIFTVPEAPDSTLAKLDQAISENLIGFLQKHIVAEEREIEEIEKDFASARIPEQPMFVSEQAQFLLDKVVAQSVHTASPSFVGHMTSALPYFMLPLSKIMIALNQNLVKTETSKAFTPLERQVLGMIHQLVYGADDDFYQRWMHDSHKALGAFCSGGTIANITALWVARNRALGPKGAFRGVAQEGVYKALRHYGYEGVAVLVSKRGHYSLGKAVDLLGFGRELIVTIETDENNRVRVDKLRAAYQRLESQRIKVIALVGIAGTTETGNVDPLNDLADLAEEYGVHFHVDAAWGGPTLFSQQHRPLMKGIERADSVTIDAHKQLYVPMGAGMVVFKDPSALNSIEHHAQYIIREGSKDLGSTTLEGSRPGMAMLVHSALRILGRKGYELLVERGIRKARMFAELVEKDPDFELVTAPELNIFTYRYVPAAVQRLLTTAEPEQRARINDRLSRITRFIQKTQREHGKAFVSRTRLTPARYSGELITVFRVVLANPLTDRSILEGILEEQKQLASDPKLAEHFAYFDELLSESSV